MGYRANKTGHSYNHNSSPAGLKVKKLKTLSNEGQGHKKIDGARPEVKGVADEASGYAKVGDDLPQDGSAAPRASPIVGIPFHGIVWSDELAVPWFIPEAAALVPDIEALLAFFGFSISIGELLVLYL